MVRNWSILAITTTMLGIGCDDDADRPPDFDTDVPTTGATVPPSGDQEQPTPPTLAGCVRVDLVADQAERAQLVDPDLVNGWGIAHGDAGFWIPAEATGKVAIYDGTGLASSDLGVKSGSLDLGEGITGVARDLTGTLQLGGECAAGCGEQATARFVFASVTGQLIAVTTGLVAKIATIVDRSADGAVYTGVAIAGEGEAARILAADFANARIDMFDMSFKPCDLNGAFTDAELPEGYAPYNVAVLGEHVLVAYAKQSKVRGEEEIGAGLGIVSEFDLSGRFVRRVATGGDLNAPWGITLAPANFCQHTAAMLLIGNFGDGRIIAIDAATGKLMGPLNDATGAALAIDGLWGITFGAGAVGRPDVLYFAAGPADEAHGLYGRIEPVAITY
jgi:uncharacterized protein (TIGR03118 family)